MRRVRGEYRVVVRLGGNLNLMRDLNLSVGYDDPPVIHERVSVRVKKEREREVTDSCRVKARLILSSEVLFAPLISSFSFWNCAILVEWDREGVLDSSERWEVRVCFNEDSKEVCSVSSSRKRMKVL